MPVQIGAPTHDFSDPTGLLSDCHRRIEMFLSSLDAVARTIDRPLTDETGGHSIPPYATSARLRRSTPLTKRSRCFRDCVQIHHPDVQPALARLEELERRSSLGGSFACRS